MTDELTTEMITEFLKDANAGYRFFAGDAWAYPASEINDDVCVVQILGNHEERIVRKAVDFLNRVRAEFIVISGGLGRGTPFLLRRIREQPDLSVPGAEYLSEAEIISRLLPQMGLNYEPVIITDCSSANSFENQVNSLKILRRLGLQRGSKVHIVQTPAQRLRALRTAQQVWKDEFEPRIVLPDNEPKLDGLEAWKSKEGIEKIVVELFRTYGWTNREWGIYEEGEMPLLLTFNKESQDISYSMRRLFNNVREQFESYLASSNAAREAIRPYLDANLD